MSDGDRGQALIVTVLFLAIAAATLSGLRLAQDRIFAAARERRAGEAAVEAATAVIADAYTVAGGGRAAGRTAAAAVADPSAREAAREAAQAMSTANGGGGVSDVSAQCRPRSVDVAITLGGRIYRAGFEASCSQR
jgi:hypothetical protein